MFIDLYFKPTFSDIKHFWWCQWIWLTSSTFGHVENISRDSVVLLPQLVIHCFNLVCCHLQYHHYPSRHHHCPKARVWKPQSRKVKRIWQISNTTLILCRKGFGRYKKTLLSPTQCQAGCPSRRKSRCSPECLAYHLQFNDANHPQWWV